MPNFLTTAAERAAPDTVVGRATHLRLKFGSAGADAGDVRFDRLVIESGASTFSLDFHPRLTVITGVGRLERDGLINELLAAVGPGRSGVHVELTADNGSRYAVFRPVGAVPRIVDVDLERDVTAAFTAGTGQVDLLARAGMSVAEARARLRITAEDLAGEALTEERIARLAGVDQPRLWDVARKVTERQGSLDEAAAAAGSCAEDAEAIQEVERRHQAFEEALGRHDRVRQLSFMVAGISAIAAMPAAAVLGGLVAVPLMIASVLTAVLSIRSWRLMEQARSAEQDALRQVGAQTYLDFHVTRVNGMVAGDHRRKEFIAAADRLRAAMIEWELLAGDIPVKWAVAHQGAIREAAAHERSRSQLDHTDGPAVPRAAAVAEAFAKKVAAARAGGRDERLPIILDDPFGTMSGLDADAAASLLARLAESAGAYQLIYLAESPEVSAWAQHEAQRGNLAVITPERPAAASGEASGAGDAARPGHVAA